MATAPANDEPAMYAPGDIIPLDPNAIDLGERLRPIDMAWAAWIGQSMKVDGQIHAVEVKRTADGGWILAGAGGHRVTGARLAGIAIEAKIVMFGKDVARRREVIENLIRRANDPIERAEAIAELARLHRERAGLAEAQRRERHAGRKPGNDFQVSKGLSRAVKQEAEGTLEIVSNVYGFTEELGAELGCTGRTIRNDLLLYRGLRPSVIALFRENRHPVLKNAAQLRQLAKLEPSVQERVAARMIDQGYGAPKSVSQAVELVKGRNRPLETAESKRFNTIIGTLQRMSTVERTALFQSGDFHSLIPAEARQLLEPMLRSGEAQS